MTTDLRLAWLPLRDAAAVLSMSSDALRRALERRALMTADGVMESKLDGVHARKFSGRWRVRLAAWGAASLDSGSDPRKDRRSRPKHAITPGKEFPS